MDGGAGTLKKLYPFLDDSEDRRLLEEYRGKLRELEETPKMTREMAVLKNAISKVGALIDRKRYMRLQFLELLRRMSKNAAETCTLFSQEDFRTALYDKLIEESSEDTGDSDVDESPETKDDEEEK